jgi:hypothetical protein
MGNLRGGGWHKGGSKTRKIVEITKNTVKQQIFFDKER